MRRFWWAGLVAVAVLTCAAAYRQAGRLPPPPAAQEQQPSPNARDDARPDVAGLPEVAPVADASEPAPLPGPHQETREEAAVPAAAEAAPVTATTASIAAAAATAEPAAQAGEPPDLSYLHFYAYSEVPPPIKPADTVLDSLKGIPPGTPIEEIKRVSDLLKLDFTFMKTVAKIESGFDPKQRTGSYIGLFQLSEKEFGMYGSGDILDARDNTVAAAVKFMTENVMFELFTQRTPTFDDIYLIHQQGVEGAVEHLSHPRRLAWRSMCETYEGKEKGEKWCKRAIWGNTLPALKRVWKNVNRVTSADFVGMWRQRVAEFYVQYSKAAAK